MSDHRNLRHQAIQQHSRRIHDIRRAHGGKADADERADKLLITKALHEHDEQLHPGHHTKLKLRDGGHAEGQAGRRRLDRGGHRRKRADGGAADPGSATAAMTRAIDAGLAQNVNPAPAGRARGGKSGGGKGKGHVNVIVVTGGQDRPVPVPMPAPGGVAGPMPPRPPMMPPAGGPGMMSPGGAPGMMPPGLARPPMPGLGAPGVGAPGTPPMGLGRARGGMVGEASEPHGKGLARNMRAGAQSAEGRLAKAKMKRGSVAAAGD